MANKELNFDVRLRKINAKRGITTEKEYAHYITKLSDDSEWAEELAVYSEEDDLLELLDGEDPEITESMTGLTKDELID
jgi:hypothetical protein